MKSQTAQILSYLQEGNKLTPLEALEKFNCFRLGARIHDLRALGYAIDMKLVGDKKKYAEYSICPDLLASRRETLRTPLKEEDMYELYK